VLGPSVFIEQTAAVELAPERISGLMADEVAELESEAMGLGKAALAGEQGE